MKILNIIMKNYKVLFRSKASAAVVVVGPLLIILLVGLAFNNNQSFQVNVGTYSPDNTELSQTFVDNLRSDGYKMFQYNNSEMECIEKIQEGIVHICVAFPPNFSIENGKVNNISLHVDNSRQNLVYQVIENIKSTVQGSSSDVSLELTTDLLEALQNTQTSTTDNINKVVVLKTNAGVVAGDASNILANAETINLETGTISVAGIVTSLEDLQTELEALGFLALDAEEVKELYEDGLDSNFTSLMGDLIDDLEDLENESIDNVEAVINTVELTGESIAGLQEKITIANNAKTAIKTRAESAKTKAAQIQTDLDSVKAQLEFVQAQINALSVTDAENIVNPVNINVKNVSAESTSLIFLFPFLLVLVVMFVGILLSSTIIILEKSGRAFFRNFTTSTKDETFIISTFLTSFLLVLAQLVVLMVAGFIVLKAPLVGNAGVTIFVILLSTALFVMIGMAIGYSLTTQQATNMVSISLGSVFLLLSNLILPIETVSPALQALTRLNPYVIASEVLRKSLLFNASWIEVQYDLLMLFLYSILILIVILMTHKISKFRYLGIIPHKKSQAVTLGEGDAFEIGDKFTIKTREDLYVALVEMDEADYASYIDNNRKEFMLWMKVSLKDATLGKKFKRANREDMINMLEKVVDKSKLPKNKEFLEKKKEEDKKEEEAKAFQKEEKVEEKKEEKPKKRGLFSRKKKEEGKAEDKKEESSTENKPEDKKKKK